MENGIYDNITINDYHANRTHVSATGIKHAKASLKQFKWFLDGKFDQDALHLDFGNAAELALLDKKGFEENVAIYQTEYWTQLALQEKPELKKPKNSARYQAEVSKFESANQGKYLIPDVGRQSFQYIEEMLKSVHMDATIQKLLEGTQYQLSLFWTDDQTGLNLKTRPDICKVKKNVIVNLKTTINGSPEAFSRDLVKYDYPLQACVEISGCLATGLMNSVDNYFWLVLEKEPPFCATIYEFQESDIKSTMMEYEYLITKIAEAKEKDFYPGYSDRADNKHGILTARVPSYYLQH